jgi:hypothetical protein
VADKEHVVSAVRLAEDTEAVDESESNAVVSETDAGESAPE